MIPNRLGSPGKKRLWSRLVLVKRREELLAVSGEWWDNAESLMRDFGGDDDLMMILGVISWYYVVCDL